MVQPSRIVSAYLYLLAMTLDDIGRSGLRCRVCGGKWARLFRPKASRLPKGAKASVQSPVSSTAKKRIRFCAFRDRSDVDGWDRAVGPACLLLAQSTGARHR